MCNARCPARTLTLETDELLDLVDADDKVIGTIWRSEYDRLIPEKLGFIRAVEILIQNDNGQIWIPTRTAHKRVAPNGLDYSAAGHVGAGETYISTAIREIEEELNIKLTAHDLEFVQKFHPTVLPYFRHLYIFRSNDTPKFNPDDFVSAEWMTPQEFLEKLATGVSAKTNMQETIEAIL